MVTKITPHDSEDHDDFIDRCTDAGYDEDECELIWDEEKTMGAAAQKKPRDVSGAQEAIHINEKAAKDDGVVTFILSDETPDRMGDVIMANGWKLANFKRNPIALFGHRSDLPIGKWKNLRIENDKLKGDLELAEKGTSPRIDEMISLVEQDILRAVSVGFKPLKHEPLDEKDPWGGVRFLQQELLETSLVSVPANQNALRVVRSLGISEETQQMVFGSTLVAKDQGATQQRRAAGSAVVVKQKEARMAKRTIAEQIAGFEATRAAKAAKMEEIMDAASDKGETLDQGQQDDYDALADEVKSVDQHLDRLRVLEKTNLQKAVEVRSTDPTEAARSRGGGDIVRVEGMRTRVPKGILFARHFIARAFASLNQGVSPVEAARNFGYFEQTPELENILKAPVLVGTTTGTNWAKPLVEPQFMASEFIELLVPLTIIGRIPGLRRVPFNIKIPREITAASVNWVGEGAPKPVSAMAFDSISLGFTKVAGIVPVTDELFRFSNPAIETLVRDSLLTAVALLTDRDFLDPAKAAVPGVSPASITNGVTPITPSGTNGDALRADLGALLQVYAAANMSVQGLVLVMTSQQAIRISLMRTPLGTTEFTGMSPSGGALEGIPVITSENIVSQGSPPTGSLIVAINAPEILLADDGAVSVDMSREASLQMDSAPDSPPTASTIMVSLWQRNMVALRAERMINWMRRRDGAVQYIQNAHYT